MSNCNKCSSTLTIGTNYSVSKEKKNDYICTDCSNSNKREQMASKRSFVRDYKMSIGCEECGFKAHPAALHLAHIDRATKTTKGTAYNQSWSIGRIEQELLNCRVLCANCHSIETAKENGWSD